MCGFLLLDVTGQNSPEKQNMYVSIHRIVYLLYIFKEGKLILFKEAITVEFVLGEGDQLSS